MSTPKRPSRSGHRSVPSVPSQQLDALEPDPTRALDQTPAHELHASAVAHATDAMVRALTGPDGKFLPRPSRPETFTVRDVFRLCTAAFEAGAKHAFQASGTWNH